MKVKHQRETQDGDGEVDEDLSATAGVLAAPVVAVDIGGTTIKGAVYVPGLGAVTELRVATVANEPALDLLLEVVRDLMRQAASSEIRIEAIGIATPGRVDESAGKVLYAANLGWRDVSLADLVGRVSQTPVAVVHDGRAAAVAEYAVGNAQSASHFLIVPIGTGVGSAVMKDGVVRGGTMTLAGEIGHISIDPKGELCVCGMRGCVEAYASGSAIARRFTARTGRPADAAVVAAVIDSDEDARIVWAEAVDALARGVATVVAAAHPELVVIGGGVSLAGTTLINPFREALSSRLAGQPAPAVVASAFPRTGARDGAALIAASI